MADRSITVAEGKALMAHAISESAIRRDGSGNPALEKGRQRGRIDPLSAAVIACGLAERHRARMNRQPPKLRYAIATVSGMGARPWLRLTATGDR